VASDPEIKRSELEANHSPSSGTEAKNEWNLISTLPHAFMACTDVYCTKEYSVSKIE